MVPRVLLVLLPTFLFLGRSLNLKKETDYLLKYIKNETYQNIINNNHQYTIEDLIDHRVDVDLNIRHLLQLGVKNIDFVVLERLDDLLLSHHDFVIKMDEYEKKLTKAGLIDMLENS